MRVPSGNVFFSSEQYPYAKKLGGLKPRGPLQSCSGVHISGARLSEPWVRCSTEGTYLPTRNRGLIFRESCSFAQSQREAFFPLYSGTWNVEVTGDW